MKRVIATNYKRKALNEIYKDALASGLRAKINKEAHCVDIFDANNQIIEQRYARESGKVPGTRNSYQYVGPGNGSYNRIVRVVNETTYESGEPYIKYVYRTNDPNDLR